MRFLKLFFVFATLFALLLVFLLQFGESSSLSLFLNSNQRNTEDFEQSNEFPDYENIPRWKRFPFAVSEILTCQVLQALILSYLFKNNFATFFTV